MSLPEVSQDELGLSGSDRRSIPVLGMGTGVLPFTPDQRAKMKLAILHAIELGYRQALPIRGSSRGSCRRAHHHLQALVQRRSPRPDPSRRPPEPQLLIAMQVTICSYIVNTPVSDRTWTSSIYNYLQSLKPGRSMAFPCKEQRHRSVRFDVSLGSNGGVSEAEEDRVDQVHWCQQLHAEEDCGAT
ncbi:hypothetical protein OPV22_026222 [Ensete ventricosum]|uniref:NADP-dependent oxidoreductase domain-containing protein n=1 Tax=Ensete ventricosum TaxID=4639 RepID=A0AAV8QF91_ENSVE|nr:hypothetical protein OPV22_026222 [Ensete ventricosum]